MTLDIQMFGYGAGLVMIGWLCGMVFSVIKTAMRG